MKPCYLDLHIHTSEDANNLNKNYDLDGLLKNVRKARLDNDCLISITDHNAINKDVYLKLNNIEDINFVVGVELTVRNYSECKPYHCHFYFDVPKDSIESKIDDLNRILDRLYPEKLPSHDSESLPQIQTIVASFDDYDFLVLPHGGQSHSTFDLSIPDGVRFDNTMMKTIYYNVFDGFTARSNGGLEKTQQYFKRLGINEIVNLVTCSDNYDPNKYPSDKNNSGDFVKTWMYSCPSFDGLRIALSESSRLSYGDMPIDNYQHTIKGVSLHNDRIDIDATLSPGLNVVIGSSSSGKTLFVDSLYKRIKQIGDSDYSDFDVNQMVVDNPKDITPHYFSQNYILNEILKMVRQNKGEKEIQDITLLNDIFKFDEKETSIINSKLEELVSSVNELFSSANCMKQASDSILSMPNIVTLLDVSGLVLNPYELFAPNAVDRKRLGYSEEDLRRDISFLDQTRKRINNIPFIQGIDKEIDSIIDKLEEAQRKGGIEILIRDAINKLGSDLNKSNGELSSKKQKIQQDKKTLLEQLTVYSQKYSSFYSVLEAIKSFKMRQSSKDIDSSGHLLSVTNKLEITNEVVVDHFSKYFGAKVKSVDDISPDLFDQDRLLSTYKKQGLDGVKNKIIDDFKNENRVIFKILYKKKDDFFKLSPGLQASVILDIILGYDGDNAPLIIDQPEDNLSISYINKELIKQIKESKCRRQIIIVSHNATIPMLGDAQTIVLCKNENGKISISSHLLEETFEGRSMTDWIAELTDGGKKSIKKRFKKYNIKNYKDN